MPFADPVSDPVEVFYNGITFLNEVTKSTVRATPLPDPAGRTIMATKYAFDVHSYVLATNADAGDTIDGQMDGIRRRLQMKGGELRYSGLGLFGDNFVVNAPGGGGVRDVAWGPTPSLVSFESMGSNELGSGAAKVQWQCETTLPECIGAAKYEGQPLSFTYSLQVVTDYGGLSKRVYEGQMTIPLTKVSVTSSAVPVTADKYLEKIVVPPPQGFKRETFDHKLSEDRRTVKFTIVDQQWPSPNFPPANVVLVDASHDTETAGPNMMMRINTISASYELAMGTPRAWAYVCYRKLCNTRLDVAQRAVATRPGPLSGRCVPIPMKEKLSEPELFGRKGFKGSLQYRFAFPREDIIRATGLWRPLPPSPAGDDSGNVGAQRWARSMERTKVWAARGLAGLEFGSEGALAIVDLCHTPADKLTIMPDGSVTVVSTSASEAVMASTEFSNFGTDRPDPMKPPPLEVSWLDYQLEIFVEIIDGSVELKPLPTSPVVYDPTKGKPDAGYTVPYSGAPCSIVQQRTGPSIYVTLSGKALRVAAPVSAPQLVSIGGVDVVPMNRPGNGFRTKIIANFYFPITAAWWKFTYVLPCLPKQPFAPLPNPMLGSILPKREPAQGGKDFFTGTSPDKGT